MNDSHKIEVLKILIETLIDMLIEDGVIESGEFDITASKRIEDLLQKNKEATEDKPIFLTNIIGEA